MSFTDTNFLPGILSYGTQGNGISLMMEKIPLIEAPIFYEPWTQISKLFGRD